VRGFIFRGAWALMLLTLCLLWGCSDFDEMKGQKLFNQAEAVMEDGDAAGAEALFADLVAKYPRTQAGEQAQVKLDELLKKRLLAERQIFHKVLDSYRQVLDGYRSLYSEYPATMEDLDTSDYFFDSGYLVEITPEEFDVYLWLASDNSSFRAWGIKNGLEHGFVIVPESRKLESFSRDELLASLGADYREVFKSGGLTVLAR